MKNLVLAAAFPLALLAGCASTGYSSGGASSDYGSAPMAKAPAPMAQGAMPTHMREGVMVNAQGITVYTFDKDVAGSGKSVCNGPCAVKWPPAMAGAADKDMGDFSVVTRDDGAKQWAYKGKPLYTWPEDQEPGDKYGDGYLKVWHIVKP